MNYQFKRTQEGTPIASFENSSDIFSQFFSEELGADQHKIQALLTQIDALDNKQIQEDVFDGKHIRLQLNQYEVEVQSKLMDYESQSELPDGTHLDEDDVLSGCGLEDFKQVLLSWQQYVQYKC